MTDRHVLLVDDLPEMVDLLTHHLDEAGYRVSSRGTGQAALERVREGFDGVVVLDLMLPDQSGVEICKKLLEILRLLSIEPVVWSMHPLKVRVFQSNSAMSNLTLIVS